MLNWAAVIGLVTIWHRAQAFARTEQLPLADKFHNAVRLGTSPIVRALFDFDGGMDMVRELDDITFTEWFTQLGGSR
jgi:zeta-carotene desaturase